MKLKEIFLSESSEFDDILELSPEAAADLYDHTMKRIKKMTEDGGWYGGISGTEFYNRDWKRDISKEKKKAALLKKQMNKKLKEALTKDQLDEHGDQELDGKDRNPFSKSTSKQDLQDIVKKQSGLLHSRYGLVKAIEVVKRHIQRAKTSDGKKLYQAILKELEDVKAYQDKYKKEYDDGNTGDFYDPKSNIHKLKD